MEVIGDMKTKKVLWISRHEPLQAPKNELAETLGDDSKGLKLEMAAMPSGE